MFLLSLFMPLAGTVLGSFAVIFNRNNRDFSTSIVSAFTDGIMLSAAIWSLLIPSLNYNGNSDTNLILVVIGLITGFLFILSTESKSDLISRYVSKLKLKTDNKILIQTIAVILHNIPEGVAVGALLSGFMSSGNVDDLRNAFSASLGISIQNIPEGAIISVPAFKQGNSKIKSFILGAFSGVVELISAVVTLLISEKIYFLIPLLMSFSAGTMIHVVTNSDSKPADMLKTNIAFISGFILMMTLDNAI